VVGVLSNKDVLLAMGRDQLQPQDSVTGLLREAYFVPETKTISDAFSEMQQGGYGLMLTVDEFGGIAGLCTMKQLLEVIVGEVGGEGNLPEDAYTALGDNSYKVSAAVTIEEINEKLDLAIPEGDYQTVAGFILDQIGYIPEAGEVLEYRNMKLTIKQMNGVRIDTVELEKLQKVVEEEEAK
jgi:putative hemolysin